MQKELLMIFIMERGLAMFKPNCNQDRRDYSNLLLPPEGYKLDKAIGTTYSLDLEALTAISICLGLVDNADSKIMQNPISMLTALQKVSDKILIFCDAGQIKSLSKPNALFILLEKIVIPIVLPKQKGSRNYPSFHPKTWLLSYINDAGDKKYRFVVMSRNLTFDRSWDITFSMDSSTIVRQKDKTKPIIDFLNYLRGNIHNTSPDANKKRKIISCMETELENISFSLNSRVFDENFRIMPLGIGEKSYDMNNDVLLCNELNSSSYTFHELVVMSPFLSDSVIESFNKTDRGLTDCKRTLITRRSELSKINPNQANNFNIYTLKDEIVDGEDYISDEDDKKLRQDIHAKIYLRRKYSDVDLYLGSMNASNAAINQNVEMMIRLTTKNRYLNGDMFLNDIFCGAEDGLNNPFEKVFVTEETKVVTSDEQELLERKIKTLCRIPKKAYVKEQIDGKYSVQLEIENIEEDENITISPFNSKQKNHLTKSIIFEGLELLQLSEFYEVTASLGDTTIHRIIMIPTSGIPEEREAAVINSIVKNRLAFVEYIAFVLADDYLISLIEEKQLGETGFFKQSPYAMPALYEKMLKTSLEAPERLKDIGYILKMITDKEIIPDEFRETYETFCKTLKIK